MASTFDLNNVFVYYIWAINPAQEFSDMLSVLRTDQITLSFGDVTYDPPIDLSALQGSPEVLASTSFKNDTDVTDSAQFQQNKSTTASFSVAISEGVKIGAETTVQTQIPFIAKGEVSLSAEASLSSTQNVGSSETQSFSVNTTINVPPRSRVEASLLISSLSYKGKLNVQMVVGGQIRILFGSTRLVVPIADVITAIQANPPGNWTFTDKTGAKFQLSNGDMAMFSVTDTKQVQFAASGDLQAKFGAKQTVDVKQFNLTDGKLVREFTV